MEWRGDPFIIYVLKHHISKAMQTYDRNKTEELESKSDKKKCDGLRRCLGLYFQPDLGRFVLDIQAGGRGEGI